MRAAYPAYSRVPTPSMTKSQSYEKRAAISAPSGGPRAKPPLPAKRVRAKLWRSAALGDGDRDERGVRGAHHSARVLRERENAVQRREGQQREGDEHGPAHTGAEQQHPAVPVPVAEPAAGEIARDQPGASDAAEHPGLGDGQSALAGQVDEEIDEGEAHHPVEERAEGQQPHRARHTPHHPHPEHPPQRVPFGNGLWQHAFRRSIQLNGRPT